MLLTQLQDEEVKKDIRHGDGVWVIAALGYRGEEEGERFHVFLLHQVEGVGASDVHGTRVLRETVDKAVGGRERGVVFF